VVALTLRAPLWHNDVGTPRLTDVVTGVS
jgi:hypothetical protein